MKMYLMQKTIRTQHGKQSRTLESVKETQTEERLFKIVKPM